MAGLMKALKALKGAAAEPAGDGAAHEPADEGAEGADEGAKGVFKR